MNPNELTGRSEKHLASVGRGHFLHMQTVADFKKLKDAALIDGIDIQIVSSFRNFERQKTIWNAKALGQRKLIDLNGDAVVELPSNSQELIHLILRWSALPGASRHHWGSDFDIYDATAVAEDYQVRLEPAEYSPTGVFAKLSEWLVDNMRFCNFFFPYKEDQGGVACEPWHLSHGPVAKIYMKEYSLEFFESFLAQQDYELISEVRLMAAAIYERYVINICDES